MRCDFGKKADDGDAPGNDGIFGIDMKTNPCGLIQRDYNMRWRLIYGKTPSAETGPNHARTKSGGYIFTEASYLHPGDTAVMYTKELSVQDKCNLTITFYYHMYGSDMGELRVRQTGTKTLLWSASGQQHDDGLTWSLASIHLPFREAGDVQFDFVGVRGDTQTSDIGLDDISIVQDCPPVTGMSWVSYTSIAWYMHIRFLRKCMISHISPIFLN